MSLVGMFAQKMTYWEPGEGTNLYGKANFNAPVVKNCRWEDKQNEIIGKRGEEIVSKTRIYTEGQIKIDGFIALGEHSEVDPADVEEAVEIQQVTSTPSLRNLTSLTTVYL